MIMYKVRLEDTMNSTSLELIARYSAPNPEMTLDREFRRQFESSRAKVAVAKKAKRLPRYRDARFLDGVVNTNTLAAGGFFRLA